jgi:hypothetical protein
MASAEHTLNNCHEYDPGDGIMGLAKPFTGRSQNECLRKFPYAVTQIYY